ncbi:ATPase [Sporomusaceae bacterium FL31]|nr:ATPase [Sporomusaceae bacterium FL31]GCE33161.1 ATPase [Sporomusaceae bacterium]
MVYLFGIASVEASSAYPTKKVLIMYSYNQDLPFYADFTAGLKQRLEEERAVNIQFFYEYLDMNASVNETFSQALATVLRQKYQQSPPDSIVIHGMPGIKFLLKYGLEIFGDIPITAVVTRIPNLGNQQLPSNYTVYYPTIDIAKTVQMIIALQPETENLHVIIGESSSEQLVRSMLPEQLEAFSKRLTITYLDNLTAAELLGRIKEIDGSAAILFIDFAQDSQQNRFIPAHVLRSICTQAQVPVFGSYSTHLADAAVGGYVLNMHQFGLEIGEKILAALRGGHTANSLESVEVAHYMADWKVMQRWNMSERKLPSGTVVINQPASVWTSYTWHIFGIILIIVVQAVLISRHMRKRKQAEKELARLDQLHLVGEMAAGIGHEIRNPLTTVRGYLQLLGIKKKLPNPETLQIMISELDRANSIITEFLKLAKNKVIQRSLYSLNDLVENLMPILQAEASLRGHDLIYISTATPAVMIDEKEVHQVVLNLVMNGLDAMTAHGVLKIQTSTVQNRVMLSITDQGPGIPDEVANKIGTPFFTTKANGTGLGLSICFAIAERHGGRLEFITDPNGTTFNFYLPIPKRRINHE